MKSESFSFFLSFISGLVLWFARMARRCLYKALTCVIPPIFTFYEIIMGRFLVLLFGTVVMFDL